MNLFKWREKRRKEAYVLLPIPEEDIREARERIKKIKLEEIRKAKTYLDYLTMFKSGVCPFCRSKNVKCRTVYNPVEAEEEYHCDSCNKSLRSRGY